MIIIWVMWIICVIAFIVTYKTASNGTIELVTLESVFRLGIALAAISATCLSLAGIVGLIFWIFVIRQRIRVS